MTAALASGHKVFYTWHDRDPLRDTAEHVASMLQQVSGRMLVEVVAHPTLAKGEVGLEDSYDWHLHLLQVARRQGFDGAAFTGDRQLHHLRPHREAGAEQDALVEHERVLERVSARPDARVLCRYNPQLLSRGGARHVLTAHFRNVDDQHWGADVVNGRLVVSGEIDLANVVRFAHVLDAAVRGGVLTVDLADIELLGADGIGALERTASRLAETGRCLLLMNLPPVVRRTMSVLGLTDHPGLCVDELSPALASGAS